MILSAAYPPGAAAAAQNPLPTTFIFVTEMDADSELAHVAAQRVLAQEFGLYFTGQAAVHAKVSSDRVESLKHRLGERDPGLFKGLRGLRPPSQAAHSAFLKGRIETQGRRFQHFTTDPTVRVDAARIRAFLDQFPEALVEPMLAAIETIHWLDRPTLGRQFAEQLLSDAPPEAIFAPLTSEYGKSAAHLPYFLADHPSQPMIADLQHALTMGRPIVVFDDVLISGVQSRRVVDTWFGQGDHPAAPALSEAGQASLATNAHAFNFAYAWRPGLEGLTTALTSHQVGATVEALRTDETEKPLDAAGAASDELRAYLREVGYELLWSTKGSRSEEPWAKQRCEESSLGYGNDERLVVLEYNTPTGTVTSLWKDGVFDGAQWLPLFPRRQTST